LELLLLFMGFATCFLILSMYIILVRIVNGNISVINKNLNTVPRTVFKKPKIILGNGRESIASLIPTLIDIKTYEVAFLIFSLTFLNF